MGVNLRMKRAKSQIFFKYLPGATFLEEGYWFKIHDLVLSPVEVSEDLLNEVKKFVASWDINRDLEYNLYPQRDNMYYLAEIKGVMCELFPLVFYCNNSECGNIHSYESIDMIKSRNPELKCEYCGKGQLKQYPYVLVHENGDIQQLKVPTNKSNTWKGKYDGIRMLDTRRFTTASWYNYKNDQIKGELGFKITRLPIAKGMNRLIGGKHMAQGDIYYPHMLTFVNLKNDTLTTRKKNEDFPYIQLAGLFRLKSINLSDFSKNYNGTKDSDVIHEMLSKATNDEEKKIILKLGGASFNNTNAVKKEIDILCNNLVNTRNVIEDRALHEFIFAWYENHGEMVEDKIEEAKNKKNSLLITSYSETSYRLKKMGIETAMILEKLPILTMAIGYTRKFYDKTKAILNPFKQRINERDHVVIPVLKSENEAIIFKLDPIRVFAWLKVNNFIDFQKDKCSTVEEAHAIIYSSTKFGIDEKIIVDEKAKDFKNDKKMLSTIMIFRLIHSYVHTLLQSGKTILGLDIDSISEYLFPSALSFAIYVSKLQGGMGCLVSAFENDLEKWLRINYDKMQSCLYDPVCHEHKGACHACMYVKFSCKYFNYAISRNILIGGVIEDYDENKYIYGYFSKEVDVLMYRWKNEV
ncbi:hypothetical protein ACJDU8_11115 [Clostridium sp. WILCCON 0269]|uniref:DUF1998 domain-containing protein n=1 Tax=Candidatus Clostridium eludens TaxID=3381663 RepID=A0ABW8SMY1_9CLOT